MSGMRCEQVSWSEDGPPRADGRAGAALLAHELGQEILRARHVRTLSQRELAAASGVPQSTISRLESGQRLPELGLLDRLLRPLGLELSVSIRPRALDVDQVTRRAEAVDWDLRWGRWAYWFGHLNRWATVCPVAISGPLGAVLHGLPLEPVRVDLVASADPDHVEQLWRGLCTQTLSWIDGDESEAWIPEPEQLLARAHLFTDHHTDLRVVCSPRFAADEVAQVAAGSDAVPVLALHRIAAEDPWVARVWDRLQERSRR